MSFNARVQQPRTGVSFVRLLLLVCGLCISSARCGAGDAIVNLSAQNFTAATNVGDWFLLFYAPWCNHCKRTMPAFGRLARRMQKANWLVHVARVDCVANSDVCAAFDVRRFVCLRFVCGLFAVCLFVCCRCFYRMTF